MDVLELQLEHLLEIFPYMPVERAEEFYPFLHRYMLQYAIITPNRMAAFLSQIGHESGEFMYVEEIASGSAYEGRKDLGNTLPGYGVIYKGRGLIQVTGRNNYMQLHADTGIDCLANPGIVAQPENAVLSACWYWNKRNINFVCDQADSWFKVYMGKKRSKIEWITILVNGGLNGLSKRKIYHERALKVLIRSGV